MSLTRIFLLALLSVSLIACDESPKGAGSDAGQPDSTTSTPPKTEIRLFGVEKGVIEYQISGRFVGTETLYFDRWGARQAVYTKKRLTSPAGVPEEHSLKLTDGRLITTVDLKTRKGRQLTHPLWDRMVAASPAEREKMIAQMTHAMGGKPDGEGEVLGRPCTITAVKMVNLRTWVWKNITLRTDTGGMVNMKQIATRITLGEVPEDKLRLPEDIELAKGMPKIPGRR